MRGLPEEHIEAKFGQEKLTLVLWVPIRHPASECHSKELGGWHKNSAFDDIQNDSEVHDQHFAKSSHGASFRNKENWQ